MLPCFIVLSLTLTYFTQLSRCLAAITNRTIDDTNGDPITGFMPMYTPNNLQWNVGSACTGCKIQPDPDLAFDSNWHAITRHEGDGPTFVTLNFTGAAIYLFSFLPSEIPWVTTLASLQFTLDGEMVGTYAHSPDNSSTYEYSVPVISLESFVNKPHTLVAEPVGTSYFIFDYVFYT
ncbi:hypothetical protein GGX14DRAFT_379556 [Mycena pura]|uniref:Uncharacterized protein n=1 Tax=Mycena pura TaxID=153505 RepID=A0AAD6URK7_9AGAR|nr:hypothetical protein GGX14DRAFT_379556 [Mycena pura]